MYFLAKSLLECIHSRAVLATLPNRARLVLRLDLQHLDVLHARGKVLVDGHWAPTHRLLFVALLQTCTAVDHLNFCRNLLVGLVNFVLYAGFRPIDSVELVKLGLVLVQLFPTAARVNLRASARQ